MTRERQLTGSSKTRLQLGPRLAIGKYALSTALTLAFLPPVSADGPVGRPVVGHIIVPVNSGVKVDWAQGSNWIRSFQPAIKPPEGLSAQEKFKWYQGWSQSEAGKAYLGSQRAYPVKIAPDGSFRVDDVPAGTYVLSIRVTEPPEPKQSRFTGELLGSVTHTF